MPPRRTPPPPSTVAGRTRAATRRAAATPTPPNQPAPIVHLLSDEESSPDSSANPAITKHPATTTHPPATEPHRQHPAIDNHQKLHLSSAVTAILTPVPHPGSSEVQFLGCPSPSNGLSNLPNDSATQNLMHNILRDSPDYSPQSLSNQVSTGSDFSPENFDNIISLNPLQDKSVLNVITHLENIGQSSRSTTTGDHSPYSLFFFYACLESAYQRLFTMDVIPQRRLNVHTCASRAGVFRILTSACLLQTVQRVDCYVKTVVCEFYANLVPDFLRIGKVYVRGVLYDFSPAVINDFFGVYAVDELYCANLNDVTSELTGGLKTKWIGKDTIRAVDLTLLYAYLHRIACSNWMPNDQCDHIPRDMVIFLFKVTKGIKTDIGRMMYDQIVDARDSKAGHTKLIFPNLIYSLLVMQGFAKQESDVYENDPDIIKIDPQLLKDSAVSPPALHTTTIQFLETELQFSRTQREHMVAREHQLEHYLNVLKNQIFALPSDGSVPPTDDTSTSSQ